MTITFPYSPAGYTAANGWRPLRLETPYQRGWDVYDLQCKLAFLAYAIDTDGILGPQTNSVIRNFQNIQQLTVDGIAGSLTQVSLGLKVCKASALPERVHGQMEKESSLLCGIYTAPYGDTSRDRGPVQENSRYYPDGPDAFDVRKCVPVLVSRIKAQAAKYESLGVERERAWAAAQGHWNNPVNADRYARGLSVPQAFLDYIAAVTAYI